MADNPAPGLLPADPYLDLNGRLLPSRQALISPLGEGFQYGRGLFETIKVLGGQPVFWREHLERLRRGAAELGLGALPDAAEWSARCRRLISANRAAHGSLKLIVFADTEGAGQLMVMRNPAYGPEVYARGFQIQTVAEGARTGGLSALKTMNYLRPISARRAAQAAGFDDALFIGADGAVLESASSNLFAVRDGAIRTPPATGKILPGIARAQLLARLRDPGVTEGPIDADWLRGADEVFVTNSLLGVMPVSRLDDRNFDLTRNPWTRAAMAAWAEWERESAASAGV